MQTQHIVVGEAENSGGNHKSKFKSLENRMKAGKRLARILRNQHRLRPFTHEFVLRFNVEVDQKRFRRRISEQLSGTGIHVVWVYCVSMGGTCHYHSLVFTESASPEKTLRTAILKALNKDARHKPNPSLINLHFEAIRDVTMNGLIQYTAKSTPELLRKDRNQTAGCRESFKTGAPYTKPTEELAKLTPMQSQNAKISWLMNRPEVVEGILDGDVDPHHKRFLWMAYSGRNVSECRPVKDTAHNSTTFSPTPNPKPSTSPGKPPNRIRFEPNPPDQIIGQPMKTKF